MSLVSGKCEAIPIFTFGGKWSEWIGTKADDTPAAGARSLPPQNDLMGIFDTATSTIVW